MTEHLSRWDRFCNFVNARPYLAIAVIVAGLAFVATDAIAAEPVTSSTYGVKPNATVKKGQPTPFWFRTPCYYEDSVNCYWDAGRRGNGVGQSFYIRDMPGPTTCLFYVNRKYAKKHDSCFPDDV